MIKSFATRPCVLSLTPLFESFKEKNPNQQKEKKKSQNVKYFCQLFQFLLLLNFPAIYLQKGFAPGEKPQHKMSYWDTGTCIFLYIFIYPMCLSGIPMGPTFSVGLIALTPLWRKRAEMTHLGWGQRRGLEQAPWWVCGCDVWQVHKSVTVWCSLEVGKM